MKRTCFRLLLPVLVLTILCLCCSCGSQDAEETSTVDIAQYEPGVTHVLTPQEGSADVQTAEPLTLDFSYADQGYFTGYLSEDQKINIQVTGPDQVTYKYFLNQAGVHTTFPFTAGSGAYIVLAFEHVGNDQYISLLSYSLNVEITNEFLPFLYPNQYVNFSEDSQAVALAAELSADAETDIDALTDIYDYVTEYITYDDDKAATVESGYLPDIDDTLCTGTGICFDYAALTVAMLRSLSIPARLNIGYSGDIRHAWVDVYIQSVGWVNRAVEFKGNDWELMDPTFASAFQDDDLTNSYIGNGDNYILEYVR